MPNPYSNISVSSATLVLLSSSASSPQYDAGLIVDRGTGATQAILWDESSTEWSFVTINGDHSVSGEASIAGYSNIKVGSLTTTSGITFSSLNVSGNTVLTSLTASSANIGTTLSVTGNTTLQTVTASTLNVSGTSSLFGLTVISEVSETMNSSPGATASVVVYDFNTGSNWYHSSATTNYTANFTNVPTTNDRVTTVTVVIEQGATAYIPTVVQINSVTQTVKWSGGTASGTANQVDIVGFTFIRSAGSWAQVLGQINTFD